MDINNKRISATPRSKYTSYAGIGNYTSNSSSGNFNSSNYLKLSGEETQTVEGDVAFTGDVIAYTDNPEAGDVTLPIASENTLGCVKVGEGLNVDGYGVITIDPYYVGSGGSGNIPDWVTDTKPNVSYFTNDANYLKSTDNITANKLGTTTIGNTAKGIYLDNGTPMPLSATVGSASIPVYINGGLPTVCTSINLNAASATKLLNSRSL